MADVLIVCVREDEVQAKALADMFEAAGFSVGGAPSNDGALRSSGAGVVVWSQASIRSRPFLDAAQRVINAGKGVLACLIEPPPAESVNDSPAFDLTGWAGDANDPSLDPLFFAVDRMVNVARAAVGAAPAGHGPEPQTYESPNMRLAPTPSPPQARPRPVTQAPPPQLPPAYRPRPPRAPEPPPMNPMNEAGSDGMGGEADHWRAIRHSKDPTAFLDYLARYGPEGAFSELAEFRLKQLEGQPGSLRGAARSASGDPTRGAYDVPRRRPEPPRGYEAPPRRPEPPSVRLEPTRLEPTRLEPTRAEPPQPPMPMQAPPRRRPSYNDDYRPPIDNRDAPKKEGGGFLRSLVVLLLIGGAVTATAIYFGLGDKLSNLTQSGPQREAPSLSSQLAAGPISEPSSSAPASATPSTPQYPAATVVSPNSHYTPPPAPTPQRDQRPVQTASSNPAPRNPTTPQPSRGGDPNAAAAPRASWTDANPTQTATAGANGGPVSLLPSQNSSPVTSAQPASTTVPSAATPAVALPSVLWAQRATADRLASNYPANALRSRMAGSAVLDCVVRGDFGVTCFVSSETPRGEGFGRAALNIVGSYRARPTLSDGTSSAGAHTRISISFRPPPQE